MKKLLLIILISCINIPFSAALSEKESKVLDAIVEKYRVIGEKEGFQRIDNILLSKQKTVTDDAQKELYQELMRRYNSLLKSDADKFLYSSLQDILGKYKEVNSFAILEKSNKGIKIKFSNNEGKKRKNYLYTFSKTGDINIIKISEENLHNENNINRSDALIHIIGMKRFGKNISSLMVNEIIEKKGTTYFKLFFTTTVNEKITFFSSQIVIPELGKPFYKISELGNKNGIQFDSLEKSIQNQDIADVINYSQNHRDYIGENQEKNEFLDADEKTFVYNKFKKEYFDPWVREKHKNPKDDRYWAFNAYSNYPGYGILGEKNQKGWLDELRENSGVDNFTDLKLKAITTVNTSLRAIPTLKPRFQIANDYPFDDLQVSGVWANKPIYVTAFSNDKQWVLVETSYAMGWIETKDIAFVNDNQVKSWMESSYVAPIKDNINIAGDDLFYFKSRIGNIFPLIKEEKNNYHIQVFIRGLDGNAIEKIVVVSKDDFISHPGKPTYENLSKVSNNIMGITYGWGNILADRDCSAMLRDLLITFGIWIPRNSYFQAHYGIYNDISELSNIEKKKTIFKNAKPYKTLIYLRGHVMMYIGEKNGEPIVFHTPWGVRTQDYIGGAGVKIIGKPVITTLSPGKELPNISLPNGDILNRIIGYSQITEEKQK